MKHKVKNAVQFISDYERAMARMARDRGADGIICGHIHHAEIREIDGITYMNDGDWVEGCTALVEHFDGWREILHFAELRGLVPLKPLNEDQADDTALPATTAPAFSARIPLEAINKAKECEYSSSPTHGIPKSTASSAP